MLAIIEELSAPPDGLGSEKGLDTMIEILSSDYGSTLYHDGTDPDFDALDADGRIAECFDPMDWTHGDYTYDETDRALYLTGTGEMLWRWIED